jgi:hypothetical protein
MGVGAGAAVLRGRGARWQLVASDERGLGGGGNGGKKGFKPEGMLETETENL